MAIRLYSVSKYICTYLRKIHWEPKLVVWIYCKRSTINRDTRAPLIRPSSGCFAAIRESLSLIFYYNTIYKKPTDDGVGIVLESLALKVNNEVQNVALQLVQIFVILDPLILILDAINVDMQFNLCTNYIVCILYNAFRMNNFSAKNGWVKLSSRDTCSSKYFCKLKRYSRLLLSILLAPRESYIGLNLSMRKLY